MNHVRFSFISKATHEGPARAPKIEKASQQLNG